VLARLPRAALPEVLIGLEAPDDAAVYSLADGQALVSTVDFFTPIVDDPYAFGAIAAANALSDVYAMGGRPLFALNIVAFPAKGLDQAILIVGGHSIDDAEPKYGLAVTGIVAADRIRRKGGGRAGEALVLTKAVGTGIVSTAIKRGMAPPEVVEAAVRSMTALNRRACELLDEWPVGAVTDVSGYGLVNHLAEVARASGVAARLVASAVPLLPGARALAEQACIPGGTQKNRAYAEHHARWEDAVDDVTRTLLCDAQTSGGLLFSVAVDAVHGAVERLRAEGLAAAHIGELVDGVAGEVAVAG
jgi:selenide,water dikinase